MKKDVWIILIFFLGGMLNLQAHILKEVYAHSTESWVVTMDNYVSTFTPIANDDQYQTIEDQSLIVSEIEGILNNDTNDGSISQLSVNLITVPVQGILDMQSNGAFSYLPPDNFNGLVSFTYQAVDANGILSNVATVEINVQAVNDPPIFSNIPNVVVIDQRDLNYVLDFEILPGPTNDENPQSVGAIAQSADDDLITDLTLAYPFNLSGFDGKLQFNLTGESGRTEILLSANDSAGTALGGQEASTFTLEVIIQQTIPIAENDSFEVAEDQSLIGNILTNDTDDDTDDESLEVDISQNVQNGSLTIHNDGSFTYTPNENFFGEDSFTYTLDDEIDMSNPATVFITVLPVNDAPIFAELPDTLKINQNAPFQDIAFRITTGPPNESNQNVSLEVAASAPGLLTDLEVTPRVGINSQLRFRPSGIPGTLTLKVKAQDDAGLDLGGIDTTCFEIYVIIMQNVPLGQTDSYTLYEEQTFELKDSTILDNDFDEDSEVLTAQLVTDVQHGTLLLNADGTFNYTPELDFNGIDQFTYRASDGENLSDEVIVTLNILPVNDPPVFSNPPDSIFVNQNVGIFSFYILVNSGPTNETTQSLNLTAQSLHAGLIEIIQVSEPIIDSVEVQIRVIGQPGNAQMLIILRDDGGTDFGGIDTNQVIIPIKIIQNVPLAEIDIFDLEEDMTFTAPNSVLFNDQDEDTSPDNLSVELVDNASQGVLILNLDGFFTYTPILNFNGQDSFTYRVFDPEGNADTTSVILNVLPVNDPPIARNDTFSINEDSILSGVNVLDNDQDLDNLKSSLRVRIVQEPAQGIFTLNLNGALTYTPNENFNGIDSLIYEVLDDSLASESATVWIEVVPVNDPPIGVEDTVSTSEETIIAFNVLDNDIDVDGDSISMILIESTRFGNIVWGADGAVEYTPGLNFNGKDIFIYQVRDQHNNLSDSVVVTITVLPVNDPPVAIIDTYATLEDRQLPAASVLRNDFDPDVGDVLTARNVTEPNFGTLVFNADGTFIYTPNLNFNGNDEFLYIANDGELDTDFQRVIIQVNAVMDPPLGIGDQYLAFEDQLFNGTSVLNNDSDVDNQILTAVLIQGTQQGALTFNSADGTFTYLPNENFIGTDHFIYQAYDGELLSDSTLVTIEVQAVNDPPGVVSLPEVLLVDLDDGRRTFEFDLHTGFEEEGQGIASLSASSLNLSLVNDVSISLIDTKRARIEFTPLQVGNASLSILIQDDGGILNGGVDTASFVLNIEIIQGLLIPVGDTFEIFEDELLVLDDNSLRDNDFFGINRDPEVVLTQEPSHGTLNLNLDGTLQYQPDANYFGEDSFKYRLRLGSRFSDDEVLVQIQINPVNDPPEINGLPSVLNVERTSGEQVIEFRLTAGPFEDQNLTISLNLSNPGILSNVTIERVNDTLAILRFTPEFPGSTTLSLTVQDDGDTENGGINQSIGNIQAEIIEVAPNGIGALTANPIDLKTIRLEWEDISINEQGFIIERSLDDGINFEEIDRVGENVNTFMDSDLQIGQSEYCYRVRGFNEIGFSVYTNIACAQLRNNAILLPNTFTPNGDNRNDRFILRSLNVSEVNFRVFDRNGNLVYNTQNVNEAVTRGWDGGNQPPGVYIWAVKVRFDDGIEKNAQGKINLVR